MPRRWFDLRRLPVYLLNLEDENKINLKEFKFAGGINKSNIELTVTREMANKELRAIIVDYIKKEKKEGLEVVDKSDFRSSSEIDSCIEFKYKNYTVLIVITNDTKSMPRRVFIRCNKFLVK